MSANSPRRPADGRRTERQLDRDAMKTCFAVAAAAVAVAAMDYGLRGASAESSLIAGFCTVAAFYSAIGLFHWRQARTSDDGSLATPAPPKTRPVQDRRDAA